MAAARRNPYPALTKQNKKDVLRYFTTLKKHGPIIIDQSAMLTFANQISLMMKALDGAVSSRDDAMSLHNAVEHLNTVSRQALGKNDEVLLSGVRDTAVNLMSRLGYGNKYSKLFVLIWRLAEDNSSFGESVSIADAYDFAENINTLMKTVDDKLDEMDIDLLTDPIPSIIDLSAMKNEIQSYAISAFGEDVSIMYVLDLVLKFSRMLGYGYRYQADSKYAPIFTEMKAMEEVAIAARQKELNDMKVDQFSERVLAMIATIKDDIGVDNVDLATVMDALSGYFADAFGDNFHSTETILDWASSVVVVKYGHQYKYMFALMKSIAQIAPDIGEDIPVAQALDLGNVTEKLLATKYNDYDCLHYSLLSRIYRVEDLYQEISDEYDIYQNIVNVSQAGAFYKIMVGYAGIIDDDMQLSCGVTV